MGMRGSIRIGVIGAGRCDGHIRKMAEATGRLIAEAGAILYCGGKGGVMEAACKGASEAGGLCVGILPEPDTAAANPFVTIPVATGMGEARNLVIIRSSQALIAISGGYGTLSEMAFALKLGKPLIGLATWPGLKGVDYIESPEAAVRKALSHARKAAATP